MPCKFLTGNCLDLLPQIPDQSIDLLLTDPPYPEIRRAYGKISEKDWQTLLDGVVNQAKRVLKPRGSALFILQPNYERIGNTRLWLWEFLVRTAKAWNLVEEVYWFNTTAAPTAGCKRTQGLLKRAVKHCVWLGSPDCWRNQSAVLWTAAQETLTHSNEERCIKEHPSGIKVKGGSILASVLERGGAVSPNLLPISNADAKHSSGAYGHGAGTPYKLAEWWVKYLCPPGGTVLDPFSGAGTIPIAAHQLGRNAIGIEQHAEYVATAFARLCSLSRTESA